MAHITERDLEMRAKLQAYIDEKDAARGRPLTPVEQLANLRMALSDHDSDCASRKYGRRCDCGATEFVRNFKRD